MQIYKLMRSFALSFVTMLALSGACLGATSDGKIVFLESPNPDISDTAFTTVYGQFAGRFASAGVKATQIQPTDVAANCSGTNNPTAILLTWTAAGEQHYNRWSGSTPSNGKLQYVTVSQCDGTQLSSITNFPSYYYCERHPWQFPIELTTSLMGFINLIHANAIHSQAVAGISSGTVGLNQFLNNDARSGITDSLGDAMNFVVASYHAAFKIDNDSETQDQVRKQFGKCHN